MIGRILGLLFGFIAAVFLVTLAVANRHTVRLVLDPFNPLDPVLAAELPFYAFLFGMLIFGVILGGIATWMSQSRWRKLARSRGHDAARWRAEAERLTRERDASVAQRKSLSQQRSDGRHLALAAN